MNQCDAILTVEGGMSPNRYNESKLIFDIRSAVTPSSTNQLAVNIAELAIETAFAQLPS
ncbi:MAG: hypothetical protein OXG05_12930 [Gammaproteobacteria bacterium]|nr:hypothetical protein [Gammaproteobacteria bacterium]